MDTMLGQNLITRKKKILLGTSIILIVFLCVINIPNLIVNHDGLNGDIRIAYFTTIKKTPDWHDFLNKGKISNKTWVPRNGLSVKNFWGSKEIKQCIDQRERASNHTALYFIGDSRVRTLYSSVASLVTNTSKYYGTPKNLDNKTIISQKTNIYYKADNYLKNLKHHLLRIVVSDDYLKPSFIFLDTGSWYMRYDTIDNYTETLLDVKNVIEDLKPYLKECVIIWMVQDRVVDDKNYMWMDNTLVEKYNKIAQIMFSTSSELVTWRSGREVAGLVNDWIDSVHVGRKSDDAKANLLMNAVCSKYTQDETEKS